MPTVAAPAFSGNITIKLDTHELVQLAEKLERHAAELESTSTGAPLAGLMTKIGKRARILARRNLRKGKSAAGTFAPLAASTLARKPKDINGSMLDRRRGGPLFATGTHLHDKVVTWKPFGGQGRGKLVQAVGINKETDSKSWNIGTIHQRGAAHLPARKWLVFGREDIDDFKKVADLFLSLWVERIANG